MSKMDKMIMAFFVLSGIFLGIFTGAMVESKVGTGLVVFTATVCAIVSAIMWYFVKLFLIMFSPSKTDIST